MIIKLADVSIGKPYILSYPIEKYKQIGIKSLSMWIGWYNIYEEQTWRWSLGGISHEAKIKPGLYNFSDLVDILTSQFEGFTITVNKTNGLINMIIPARYEVWLPEAIRNLLSIEGSGWISAGEYEGDKAVEFSPKRLLIYLNQLSTSNNFESEEERIVPSQLLDEIPISSKSFGEYITFRFDNPLFQDLNCSEIYKLDFDLKIEWANGKRDKLDNHSQPINLTLEIK